MEPIQLTHEESFTNLFDDILKKEFVEDTHAGQPRYYKTPVDLANKAIEYFVNASALNQPLRLSAFILFSKLNSRQGLDNYLNYGDDFKTVVSRIKSIVEDFNAGALYSTSHNGAKFVLQCGFGWVPVEKQITENHTFNVTIGKKEEEE